MTPFPLADEAKPALPRRLGVRRRNYLVTLTHAAVALLERAGLDREAGARGARPAPASHASTSPAGPRPGRSPAATPATVAAHLAAIGPELEPLYRALGRATLPLVVAARPPPPSAELL